MRMIGNVDFDKLHPKVRQPFELLSLRLEEAWRNGDAEWHLKPFQGYRSPEEQLALLARKTTKAGPWQSAHNYGLAVDFVPVNAKGDFHWPNAEHEIWKFLGIAASNRGLVRSIEWDKPHVAHPIWYAIKSHLI